MTYSTEDFNPILQANELENLVVRVAKYKGKNGANELEAKLDELSNLGWHIHTFGESLILLQRHESLAHLDEELGAYDDEGEEDDDDLEDDDE